MLGSALSKQHDVLLHEPLFHGPPSPVALGTNFCLAKVMVVTMVVMVMMMVTMVLLVVMV